MAIGCATIQDLKHHRPVAIKVLNPDLAVQSERFLREIKIAASLQHPHIVPLYDSGTTGDLLYYVMAYVEGESLRDRLAREEQLSLDDAIRVTSEVSSALAYAHSHGVVHRDVKPENILLSGDTAVVADFGIARALEAAGDHHLTQTGTVIGTPFYMSPEQATAGGEIDGRSDQYSLACVLYECLVGEAPFTGPTPQAVMARHSLDAVSPPTIVRDTIPDAVEDALLRALSKLPADRFATTHLFAEALHTPSGTTGARRHTASAHPMAPRRSRLIQNLALAFTPLTIVAAAWGAWSWWRNAGPSDTEPPGGGLDPHRIAVLYFDDLGNDQSLEHLAGGFTEALIQELGRVSALQVISRNGVLPYRDARVAPDSIARALRAGTLVEGTVAESGGRLRVRVSLINARTGTTFGSKTLERPRTEIFELQDDLAGEVSIFLRERLGQEIALQRSRAGTENAGAWELLQEAQQAARDADALLATGDAAAASRLLTQADSLLGAAESRDERWVRPVVERARVAYRQARVAETVGKPDWLRTGVKHAERALALEPREADALELRGTLRYYSWIFSLTPDPAAASQAFAEAEADLRAAVAANGAQASAWSTLSHLLSNKSETAESKLAALRAYEADPYLNTTDVSLWRLFTSSYDLEDPVEAAHWCDEGGRRFPADFRFAECRLWLLTFAGQRPDIEKAWDLLDRYEERVSPSDREYRRLRGQMAVAAALVRAGLQDSARTVLAASRADASVDPARDLMYLEAFVRSILGDHDEAIRLLTTFLAINPEQRSSLTEDESWWFRKLKADERFKRLAGAG